MGRRLVRLVVGVIGAALMATVAVAAPAQAASRNGKCEAGEFCYYFNSGRKGSVSDFTGSLASYGDSQPNCYVFKGAGAGRNVCIKNNAASVWNRTKKKVRVYFNSNYAGAYQDFKAGAKGNLKAKLKNQNASHRLGSSKTTSYQKGDDYLYRGATSGVDPWNFYKGQCTSFAAWAVRSRVGVGFSNSYKNVHWGNAINWDNAARAAGVKVYNKPKAGDVAVRNSGTWGHVAFVTKVNSNGTFEIDEYNHVRPNTYSHRTAKIGTSSERFDKFIRFKG